jgi:hypothetical protein
VIPNLLSTLIHPPNCTTYSAPPKLRTNKKYRLVATLGARSSHSKKLTRKAITEVDVSKACGTIMEPEAPMALRLQSNLMFVPFYFLVWKSEVGEWHWADREK